MNRLAVLIDRQLVEKKVDQLAYILQRSPLSLSSCKETAKMSLRQSW